MQQDGIPLKQKDFTQYPVRADDRTFYSNVDARGAPGGSRPIDDKYDSYQSGPPSNQAVRDYNYDNPEMVVAQAEMVEHEQTQFMRINSKSANACNAGDGGSMKSVYVPFEQMLVVPKEDANDYAEQIKNFIFQITDTGTQSWRGQIIPMHLADNRMVLWFKPGSENKQSQDLQGKVMRQTEERYQRRGEEKMNIPAQTPIAKPDFKEEIVLKDLDFVLDEPRNSRQPAMAGRYQETSTETGDVASSYEYNDSERSSRTPGGELTGETEKEPIRETEDGTESIALSSEANRTDGTDEQHDAMISAHDFEVPQSDINDQVGVFDPSIMRPSCSEIEFSGVNCSGSSSLLTEHDCLEFVEKMTEKLSADRATTRKAMKKHIRFHHEKYIFPEYPEDVETLAGSYVFLTRESFDSGVKTSESDLRETVDEMRRQEELRDSQINAALIDSGNTTGPYEQRCSFFFGKADEWKSRVYPIDCSTGKVKEVRYSSPIQSKPTFQTVGKSCSACRGGSISMIPQGWMIRPCPNCNRCESHTMIKRKSVDGICKDGEQGVDVERENPDVTKQEPPVDGANGPEAQSKTAVEAEKKPDSTDGTVAVKSKEALKTGSKRDSQSKFVSGEKINLPSDSKSKVADSSSKPKLTAKSKGSDGTTTANVEQKSSPSNRPKNQVTQAKVPTRSKESIPLKAQSGDKAAVSKEKVKDSKGNDEMKQQADSLIEDTHAEMSDVPKMKDRTSITKATKTKGGSPVESKTTEKKLPRSGKKSGGKSGNGNDENPMVNKIGTSDGLTEHLSLTNIIPPNILTTPASAMNSTVNGSSKEDLF